MKDYATLILKCKFCVQVNVGFFLGEGAVLKTILNMEDLHLVQYLNVILDLQSIVIGRLAYMTQSPFLRHFPPVKPC